MGVAEDGFIHCQSLTPGNVHDSQERDALLLDDETALYADTAYQIARKASPNAGGVQNYGYHRKIHLKPPDGRG
ncbi:hypothetical protein [Nitrosococcus oceani]|uniref:hypothetical protein n=1 Tax=Nitrosococcus oceani TaxID=1229 RepID=UPI0004E9439E|nr:hypothetical protein HW44_10040 [Nitrosococcus oceani]